MFEFDSRSYLPSFLSYTFDCMYLCAIVHQTKFVAFLVIDYHQITRAMQRNMLTILLLKISVCLYQVTPLAIAEKTFNFILFSSFSGIRRGLQNQQTQSLQIEQPSSSSQTTTNDAVNRTNE